jgi:histidinol-phosphate aminotransferase
MRAAGAPVTVDLSSNINPFAGASAQYPPVVHDPLVAAYLEFLEWEGERRGAKPSLGPEHVLFTCGSAEGIDLVVRAFCDPGRDGIAFTPPTFPMYDHWSRANGVESRAFPLTGAKLERLPVDDLVASGAKMIFLCNPGNPTGTPLPVEAIRELLARASGLVVIDEAYLELSDEPSSAALIREHENLVVLRTFSKGWGLASLRAGALLAQPAVLHAIRLIQVPFTIPTPAAQELTAALRAPEQMRARCEQATAERERVAREIAALTPAWRVLPSVTNFFLLECDQPASVKARLYAQGIRVSDAGPDLPRCLRISVGLPDDNEVLLSALKSIAGDFR